MSKDQILIVEDESIVAKDIKNMLEIMGYAVPAVVSSGEKAIQEAAGANPDLVLMDIMLKGDLDGIQTAEQIRGRFHIPVIYLTAYADEDTLQRARITEPYGYIIKPFHERELRTAIEIALYKHKAERKLEESELQYRTTIDSLGDVIYVVDTNLRLVLFNDAFKKFNMRMGLETEVIGRYLLEIFSFLPSTVLEEYSLVFRTGQTLITEDANRIRDTQIITETRKIPIFENGKVSRVVTVIRDITENRKMEGEILKVQRLESLGLLAGGIAHDFNNILTAIMANISLALMYTDISKIHEKLAGAEKASMQARDLTQQLLTFSKGGAPIKSIASIAELLYDSITFALSGSDVKCEFCISDDLWPVEIDKGQISQVINNLIINADQAMPSGGVIKVCAENVVLDIKNSLPLKDGRYIKISIEDQGIGIPQEHLAKIFDPFFTTKEKGNGLGLATSYSIVKNHGGHITVESIVGVGTTFHIYLPASRGSLIKEGRAKEKIIMGKGRVLVMDDEEYIRDLASNILSNFGYDVTAAFDSSQAISMYKEARESGEPFDAVIMDLIVPGGISGEDAVRQLINMDPGVKAIVSSGYSNDPVMANFRQYGFKGVIAKPYNVKEMVEVLSEVINGATEPCIVLQNSS